MNTLRQEGRSRTSFRTGNRHSQIINNATVLLLLFFAMEGMLNLSLSARCSCSSQPASASCTPCRRCRRTGSAAGTALPASLRSRPSFPGVPWCRESSRGGIPQLLMWSLQVRNRKYRNQARELKLFIGTIIMHACLLARRETDLHHLGSGWDLKL